MRYVSKRVAAAVAVCLVLLLVRVGVRHVEGKHYLPCDARGATMVETRTGRCYRGWGGAPR